MTWNLQYEFIALVITLLFIVFYHLQKTLPLLKNIYFGYMLRVQFFCVIADLLASYVSVYHENMPVWLMLFSNTLYFQCMIALFFFYYLYCRVCARERASRKYRRWRALTVPFYIGSAVLVINLFTGILFTVDKVNGYKRGEFFSLIIISYIFFYLFVGTIFAIVYHRFIPLKEKCSLFISAVLIFFSVIFQIFIRPDVLLLNLGTGLAIAIMYLAMQNPEYDKDVTTRVYNRQAFERYVGERIRMSAPVQCIAVGFSNYVTIRSIYGDKKTDVLLNRIGIRIRNGLKDAVPFYMRRGHFILVLDTDKNYESVINWLKDYFSKDFLLNNDKVKFQLHTAYLYVDLKYDNIVDVEEALLASIDAAEKNEEEDTLVIDDSVFEKIMKNKTVRDIFHRTLNNDGLEVYYQPIYDNSTGRFASAEALVRIIAPEYGMIFPDQFIPIAEEDGSILRLGMQVFRKVCKFISTHDMDALGLKYIEINLSPFQCMHKGLAEELIAVAKEYNVDMSRFNFEITETAMTDTKALNSMMNVLLFAGSTFALDDYGTGFSNLINILSLPFQIVKIDKSIVWSYFNDADFILPRLTEMFIRDDLEIVAEGAETQEMTEQLKEIGCRFIQGYYYSKPVSEEIFVNFIREANV